MVDRLGRDVTISANPHAYGSPHLVAPSAADILVRWGTPPHAAPDGLRQVPLFELDPDTGTQVRAEVVLSPRRGGFFSSLKTSRRQIEAADAGGQLTAESVGNPGALAAHVQSHVLERHLDGEHRSERIEHRRRGVGDRVERSWGCAGRRGLGSRRRGGRRSRRGGGRRSPWSSGKAGSKKASRRSGRSSPTCTSCRSSARSARSTALAG